MFKVEGGDSRVVNWNELPIGATFVFVHEDNDIRVKVTSETFLNLRSLHDGDKAIFNIHHLGTRPTTPCRIVTIRDMTLVLS